MSFILKGKIYTLFTISVFLFSIFSVTFVGQSFGYSGPLIWNKLNNYVKQYNSLQIFKDRMKTFFL